MAGKIPRAFIQDLIARIDLVDLVDARIPLKKVGVNYTARCPFHTEKSPSFFVHRDKRFYHCFGCGAHGNAIDFLMEYERQTFVEAVETLAASLGVELPRDERSSGSGDGTDGRALYSVQEQVAHFYVRQLRAHPDGRRAVEYLKRRGVSGAVAKRYELGYAPPGWRNLPETLPVERLHQAGLIIVKEQGGFYDRFRDRLMFPIRDRHGRVIGFGGRVLGDESPKYLNSPETPTFKKHREVYGLYELLQVQRRPERIVVVEGYMDVIALAQHDIPYVVATLGTATSAEHAELLFRYARELVFCFDGDDAGRRAAWKALEVSLPTLREGRVLRFLLLPKGHDPDSLVRTEGREGFLKRLEQATPLSDYFFQNMTEGLDLQTLEGRSELLRKAGPLLAKMPPSAFLDLMKDRLARLSGRQVNEKLETSTKLSWRDSPGKGRRVRPSALRILLGLLVQNPPLFRLIDEESRRLLAQDRRAGGLVRRLFAVLEANPYLPTGGLLEMFRGVPEEKQVVALSVWESLLPPECVEAEFVDAIKRYRRKCHDERLEVLFAKDRAGSLSQEERQEMRRLLSER